MRLKPKEIKQYRLKLLRQQQYMCPLCDTNILPHEATLDHDHGTGRVRRVLHRSCNQAEGRILSWIKRSRSQDHQLFVHNLSRYWKHQYDDMPLHPNHRTDIEKEIDKLYKRMKKLKTARGKQKYMDKIRDLKERV